MISHNYYHRQHANSQHDCNCHW